MNSRESKSIRYAGVLGIAAAMWIGGLAPTNEAQAAGADIILNDIPAPVSTFGPLGGVYAYVLGGGTCNIGDVNHEWDSNGSPALAMNVYRLHGGRLDQIGIGFCKHACCVINGPGCPNVTCIAGGSGLRAGCRDVYSASFNSAQGRLGPRSGIDPYSGIFTPLNGATGDAIFKRTQVAQADMDPANYPGALFFADGVFVGRTDAQNQNWNNNATYQRVTLNGSFQMTLAGVASPKIPAIFAWRDHGNGVNTPDTSVSIVTVDVPGEGRMFVGSRVRDNGNGTWHYDYAIYNLSSNRAVGAFAVPLTPGAVITNVGFHDVNYHSGEVHDNTDWTMEFEPGVLRWGTAHTFEQNANANFIQWGTMYTFWFDSSRGPASKPTMVELFRPGTPRAVDAAAPAPESLCAADIAPATGNSNVDLDDLLMIINSWGPCSGNCPADVTLDGNIDIDDLLGVINAFGPCK